MKTIYQIRRGIHRRLYSLNKFRFKHLGKLSCFYKPLKVSGKKFISLGEGVNFAEGARVEGIDEWNGIRFCPSLVISDNVSFEQFAHITFAGNLFIGRNCTFSSRVMITTIDHIYDEINLDVLKQGIKTNDVKIGNNCFIGMDVKIFPGVTIGDGVIVGANSIVLKDLPPYTVCVGTPAKPIKKYDFDNKVWKRI